MHKRVFALTSISRAQDAFTWSRFSLIFLKIVRMEIDCVNKTCQNCENSTNNYCLTSGYAIHLNRE